MGPPPPEFTHSLSLDSTPGRVEPLSGLTASVVDDMMGSSGVRPAQEPLPRVRGHFVSHPHHPCDYCAADATLHVTGLSYDSAWPRWLRPFARLVAPRVTGCSCDGHQDVLVADLKKAFTGSGALPSGPREEG